jgi:Domain of unknown function (DUF3471)
LAGLHDRTAYAEIVLEIACRSPGLQNSVAMARTATVRARIERILSETAVPAPIKRHSRLIVIGGLFLLVMAAAGPLTFGTPGPAGDDLAAEFEAPHRRVTIDAKLLDADVGFYEDMKSGSVMIVTRDGDHLITGRMGEVGHEEFPYSDYDFFLTNCAQQNHFVADASGKVSRLFHHYNGLPTIFDRITSEAAQTLQADYDRRVAEELRPHAPLRLEPAVLRDYVGYYQLTPTNILTITGDGEQLFSQATDQQRLPIYAYGVRDFFFTAAAAQITFVKPDEGTATALILHQDGMDRTAQRVSADVEAALRRRLEDQRRPHALVSIDARLLDLYAGRYGNSATTITIASGAGHLVAQVMGYTQYRIYPYSNRDFFATTFPAQIGFVTNAEGKVVQLIRHQNGEDQVLYRLDQTECSAEVPSQCLP